MNFKKIVLKSLPEAGTSITYAELRAKSGITHGLGDILYALKSAGKISYEIDESGAFLDTMEILVGPPKKTAPSASASDLARAIRSPGFASR
jgi:hypothetical protein